VAPVLRSPFALAVLLSWTAGCAPHVPTLPAPAADPAAGGGEPAPWTVEVHSGDRAAAEDVASDARLRFDEAVTVVPIGGLHHVRIGSFRTEKEAEAFARVARERGYRSARPLPIAGAPSGGP
jgi:hypothetical protein